MIHLDLSDQIPQRSAIDSTIEFQMYLPPGLEVLDLSRILVWPSVPHTFFKLGLRNHNKLRLLSLSSNGIDEMSYMFIEQPNSDVLLDLNLDQNGLTHVGFLQKAIRKGLKLRSLRLSENRLGRGGGERNEGRLQSSVFRNFSHLEILDLSANEIRGISEEGFINLKHMRTLYMSKNSLVLILFEFSHMANLSSLDLSNNAISEINDKTLEKFEAQRRKISNFKLNLRGNRLDCSCSSRTFTRWMFDHEDMFPDFEKHSCVYNESVFNMKKFKNRVLLRDLDFQCSLNLAVKLSAGLLASVFIVTLFAVFLYRHRWEVQVLLYQVHCEEEVLRRVGGISKRLQV